MGVLWRGSPCITQTPSRSVHHTPGLPICAHNRAPGTLHPRISCSTSSALVHHRRGCHMTPWAVQQAAEMRETETSSLITLPDGYKMELIHEPAQGSQRPPPLLFVHGSFHAAWCWQEHFMPFFVAAGYECFAVSLRGQGRSQRGAGMQAGSLTQHATDLGHVVASLPRPPVLVGHSFGGLVVQRYITGSSRQDAAPEQFPDLAGVALLCSAPASGNDALVKRIAKKSFLTAAKLTWGMVSKNFLRSADACRELFFSDDLPADELDRYQRLLRENASEVSVINVARMKEEVPLPGPPERRPPAFVLGAARDLLVDVPAVEETAAAYGVHAVLLDGCAHDVMLDTRWRDASEALRDWLDTL